MRRLGTGVTPAKQGGILVLAWSGLESSARQVLSLLFFFVTARFLSPADLGVFSLAVALVAIMAVLIDEPVGEALVQQRIVTASDWDTGYSLNVGIAILCLLVACLAGPLLSRLLHEPSLRFIIPVLTMSAVVGAVGNIHKAFLSRALRFRVIAQTALVAQLIGGVVTLGLAIAGFGYWALVANILVAATATTVMYRIVTPWRPGFRIDPGFAGARAPYIGYSVAIRALYLLRDQSLFIVAGAVADLVTVGYLSLAMRVARALAQIFEEVTSRPLISLISREQNDLSRFSEVLTTVLRVVGLLAIPGLVGLAETGTAVISVLVGSRWAPAGHFLPWICAGLGGWLFLHVTAVALRARGLGHVALSLTHQRLSLTS